VRQIECLTANGKLVDAEETRKHIHKKAKRATVRLATIKRDEELPEQSDQRRLDAAVAIMGTLCLFTRRSTIKQLEKRDRSYTPDTKSIMGLFLEHKPETANLPGM
jgi:hypothetical protein